MTCNNVILAQPQAESSVSYTIPEGDSARLNFTPDQISGLRISDTGELIITFEDGGQLAITNFDDLASSGNLIYMSDGTLIDPSILTSSLQSPAAFHNTETALASQVGPTVITQPQANSTQEVSMQSGQKYICNFDPANAATVELKDGAMVLTFADGSQVVINNYEQAVAGEIPAELTVADGSVVEAENILTEATEIDSIEEVLQVAKVEEDLIGEDVANIEPAAGEETTDDAELAALAESLAEIETAAGETGGGASGGGYGFNSKPVEVPLDSPDAIGPLGPTKLAYQAPEVEHEIFIGEDAPGISTDDRPTISFALREVDETNLDIGSLVREGKIDATYGNDEPGTISGGNNFQILTPFGIPQLTSGGAPVVVASTYDGYIATVNSQTVFSFVIDTEGNYKYEQFLPIDHPDSSNPDDAILINLGIRAIDVDGDVSTSAVQVRLFDGGPEAFNDDASLDKSDNIKNGNVLDNDDTGQDVGIGVAVTTPGTYTGTYGTLVLNEDGSYTYTRSGPQGGVDTFDYTMRDHDGDTSSAVLTVDVADDLSPIDINGANETDDTNLVSGPDIAHGIINVNYQGDGLGTTTGNGDFNASGNLPNGELTHNGMPVKIDFNPNTNSYSGYTGITVGNGAVFSLNVNADGTYTFFQWQELDHSDTTDDNEPIFLEFGVTATDTDGDTGEGSVIIKVLDDAPEAVDDFDSVANNETTTTGDVLDNDNAGEDDRSAPTVTTPGTYIGTFGTLVLNEDGSYTYTRSGPQGGVDTFDYAMQDNDGDTSSAVLTISVADNLSPIDINGFGRTDDTNLEFGPDVENGTINVDYQGDGPGTTTGNGGFSSNGQQANGALSHNGVPVTVSFDTNTNTYTGTAGAVTVFTMVIHDDAAYTFTQLEELDHSNTSSDNEALFLHFGVTATDSDGDTGEGTVRITVRDDGAVAHDDVNNYNTTNGGATGNVITGLNGGANAADDLSQDNGVTEASDHDVVEVYFNGNVVTIPAGGSNTIEGDFGILEIFDNGDYTYTLKPGAGAGTGGTMNVLDPTPADVAGTQSTITKNGITVTSINGGDLTFTDDGIGIYDGGGSNRVYGNDEALKVDFDPATEVVLTMGDLGNNPKSAMDFTVYLSDGTTRTIEVPVSDIPQVNSAGSVTFNAADYGAGLTITSVDVYSHITSSFSKTSFSLVEVKTTEPSVVKAWDSFEYVLQDGDGDTSIATLVLHGKDLTDDVPEIGDDVQNLDETNLDGANLVVNGQLDVDFGDDGAGTITRDGTFNVSGSVAGAGLTSGGSVVTIIPTMFGYIGQIDGSTTVFSLQINPDTGAYVFTQTAPLDHADVTDPNDVITLDFGVTIEDRDGDTDSGRITINIADDGPEAVDDKANVKNDVTSEEHCLNPSESNVCGKNDKSFTNDGITVSSNKGQDLSWFSDPKLGSGVGIGGKVYGAKEALLVTFDHHADSATFSIADMGANNVGSIFKYVVHLADGSSVTEEVTVNAAKVHSGVFDFDVDGYGIEITGVDLIGGPSFVLNNVKTEHSEFEVGDVTGNVLSNDDGGEDVATLVTSVNFEGTDYAVSPGFETVVQGDHGVLTIGADGTYSYEANGSDQTVYSYSKDNPPGSDAAGDIKNVTTSYNKDTKGFSFSMKVEDKAEGFTVALNNGPNPKGHGGELALFYFDASSATPVVSVYAYNGANTQASWVDGSGTSGIQIPDAIVSSLTSPSLFSNISVTTDVDGNKTFSFDVDASLIQDHNPIYGPDGDWTGVGFDEALGIWLHPVSGLSTEYNDDGFLTQWDTTSHGWFDTSNQTTEVRSEGGSHGEDHFTYTITDGDGDTSTASLDVCVGEHADSLKLEDGGSAGSFFSTGTPDDMIVENLIASSEDFLFNAIGESSDTLLALDAAGDDVLDISQMLETSDDVTTAIQDFVFAKEQDGAVETFKNDNQSEGLSQVSAPSVNELDQLPDVLNDQVII